MPSVAFKDNDQKSALVFVLCYLLLYNYISLVNATGVDLNYGYP